MISKDEVMDMNLEQIRAYINENTEDRLFVSSILTQISSGCELNKIKAVIKGGQKI